MNRGLTLIEIMAVVTLLAMTAAIATKGLSHSSDAAVVREACSRLNSAHQRARNLTLTNGPVVLSIGNDGASIKLAVDENAIPLELALGRVTCRLLESDGDRLLQNVYFDRLGQSDDYRIEIRSGEVSQLLNVAGLTGWVEIAP